MLTIETDVCSLRKRYYNITLWAVSCCVTLFGHTEMARLLSLTALLWCFGAHAALLTSDSGLSYEIQRVGFSVTGEAVRGPLVVLAEPLSACGDELRGFVERARVFFNESNASLVVVVEGLEPVYGAVRVCSNEKRTLNTTYYFSFCVC